VSTHTGVCDTVTLLKTKQNEAPLVFGRHFHSITQRGQFRTIEIDGIIQWTSCSQEVHHKQGNLILSGNNVWSVWQQCLN